MSLSFLARRRPARSRPVPALPHLALIGALCGLLAEVTALPPAVKAVLLLAFILIGPGSAVVHFFVPVLPPVAVRALVPVVGLCVVILTVSFTLFLGAWSPRLTLLVLALATGATAALTRGVTPLGGPPAGPGAPAAASAHGSGEPA